MSKEKHGPIDEFAAEQGKAYTKSYREHVIRADYDGNRSPGSAWAAKYGPAGSRGMHTVLGRTAAEAINKAIKDIDLSLDGRPDPTVENAHPPKPVVEL